MLTWSVVGLLMIGVYGQRALGATLVDTNRVSLRWKHVLENMPLAIISGVVALQALARGQSLAVDARLIGLAVAALCAWRRLPILVTVVAAATATALVRALS